MKRFKSLVVVVVGLVVVSCGGSITTDTSTTSPPTTSSSSSTSTTSTSTTVPPTTTTTVPTTTTAPKPPLTQEIAAASLEGVTAELFEAWSSGNEAAYPEIDQRLTETARTTLGAHSRSGDEPWLVELLTIAEDGMDKFEFTLGDDEFFPEGTFTRLAVIGVPGAPVTLFSGVYEIGETWTGMSGSHSGDETTIPGTYVVLDVEGCYWERLDSAGEIIDNNFVSAAPRVEASIRSSDYAFNSEDCGRWVRVGD